MSRIIEPDQISPNLPDWIRDHMKLYLESGGEEGHHWRGVPTLLLETLGRKSGKKQVLPLIYGRDGDDFVIVASKGGAPEHPAWYLNLRDEPRVRLQVGTEVFDAEARTASEDEKARLWPEMVSIWPAYDDYRAATDRSIPVVILSRR
ncbi:MAG: nitroreductase family deazaflavin-dependent oxidoreductase [Gammaproteobacteria bacterium]|nr:nitroreductase family deazaflavin-dependent oxidoreductase [Gammaproteobacteria bacterium]